MKHINSIQIEIKKLRFKLLKRALIFFYRKISKGIRIKITDKNNRCYYGKCPYNILVPTRKLNNIELVYPWDAVFLKLVRVRGTEKDFQSTIINNFKDKYKPTENLSIIANPKPKLKINQMYKRTNKRFK